MTFRKHAAAGFRGGPRAMHGAIAASRLIAIAVIVIVLAAGGWWFLARKPGAPIIPGTAPAPATTGSATPAAPAATVSDELTVDQLYREARKAMNENRMASPAGNNALEFYLKILAKQPDDSGAKDALRELFPFATGTAEDQINQNNFDEANRVIALLAQADPSNYSLTILRSKLDAKKKLADREQAAAAAAAAKPQTPAAPAQPNAAATAATTQPAAETPAAGTAPAAPPAATGVTPESTASTTPPPAAAPTPRPAAPPPPAPASAGGESRDVAVTSPPVPVYPLTAARNRQEGWVEVEFTVGADGTVTNPHVTASQPSRVFDREAIAAVQRAKFEPKMQNGVAVASTLRRRIEFKLGK
ncbi:MAG TPA: energy transducer TonB [Rhodanobacteraceae bacterium]|nr:energy transducer TonB [Rhodanobacteraceae bacterium]